MKKVLALVLALVLAAALCACGQQAASPSAASSGTADNQASKGKIGMLACSMSFEFQQQMEEGIKKAADEFGYDYVGIDYQLDAEKEADSIEQMATMGVGAYYGIFISEESDRALFAKHPEIATLSQSATTGANACILNDYEVIGNQFVQSLEAYCTEKGIEGGGICSLWLANCDIEDNEFYFAKQTIKAVCDEFCAKHEGFYYLDDQTVNDNEEAANVTAQWLNQYSDMRFIFALNGGYAMSAANELQAGVADTSDYFVFATDGDENIFALISDDSSPLRACAYCDVVGDGYNTGLQLINWIENGVIEDVVSTRYLVDWTNVQDYR